MYTNYVEVDRMM